MHCASAHSSSSVSFLVPVLKKPGLLGGSVHEKKRNFWKSFEYTVKWKDLEFHIGIDFIASPLWTGLRKSLYKGNLTKEYLSIVFFNKKFKEAFNRELMAIQHDKVYETDDKVQRGVWLLKEAIRKAEELNTRDLLQIIKRVENIASFENMF